MGEERRGRGRRAIVVEGLHARGTAARQALDGLDLTGRRAAPCTGVLGPNGAGKTTLRTRSWPRCCGPTAAGPRSPGTTWCARPQEVRRRIGLLGQHAAARRGARRPAEPGDVRPPAPPGRPRARGVRADELLERFGLADTGRKAVASTAAACGAGSTWPPPCITRPGGAVPGRADDRTRPARPRRGVGRGALPGRRRHDRPADHPVPGGGRPARRPHLGRSTAAGSSPTAPRTS